MLSNPLQVKYNFLLVMQDFTFKILCMLTLSFTYNDYKQD